MANYTHDNQDDRDRMAICHILQETNDTAPVNAAMSTSLYPRLAAILSLALSLIIVHCDVCSRLGLDGHI